MSSFYFGNVITIPLGTVGRSSLFVKDLGEVLRFSTLFLGAIKNMWKNLLVCLLQEHRNIARKFCMFLRKVLPSRDFDPLKKNGEIMIFFSRDLVGVR